MTTSKYAIYPSLRDRVVFVSGGGSGIGAGIVEHFVAQGSRVAFVDIDDKASKTLLDQFAKAGQQAPLYIHGDLRDIDALRAAIARVQRSLGDISVLGEQRCARRSPSHRGGDGRILGRAPRGESSASVLRRPGGDRPDETAGRRLDHQLRLHQLDVIDRRHARIHDQQGRRERPHPRAGARPRAVQHPRQHRLARAG